MPENSEIESLVIESVRQLAEDFELDASKLPMPKAASTGETARSTAWHWSI